MKSMRFLSMKSWTLISVLFLALILVGCGSSDSDTSSDAGSDAGSEDTEKADDGDKELKKVTHVLNWFAQPAHAGQYAAASQGYYEDAGLEVSIEQGGPQVSATQIVASGNADFGIANADEVLMAADEGLPLVAVAAAFQNTQQAFAFHKGQPIKEIEDFNGREVFVTPGAGYWDYLKAEYDLENVKEMAHTGSLLSFISDEESVAQVFAASEPFILEEEGIDVDLLYLKDTGYSLYFNVIFTTQKKIDEDPEAVKAFVEATIQGWDYYEDHADDVNAYLKEVNADLEMELMAKEAEAQKEFMYEGDGTTYGIGYMKEENWESIKDILLGVDVLKNDLDVNDVFTDEFLPY